MDVIDKIYSYISKGINYIKRGDPIPAGHIDTVRARIEIWKLHHRLKDHYRELGERYLEALYREKGLDEPTRGELGEIVDRIDSILTEEAHYKEKMRNG